MIHDDCTCQNEKNEESGERKNWKEGDEEKERRILNQ
jgi:hypothetical protein